MPIRDAALLLLGHGSTLNADSSAPTYQHAEEIRRRNLFAEVHVAFWKEEPNFRQALRQTRRRQVYVVPNFISSGYFTEQIIPRELGLSGPVSRLGDQEIFYCEPVGLNSAMTEALLRRAGEVVAASPETISDPAKTACLFICGHGTSFNDNSTKIIHEQAEIIRARGLYADCQAVLMEQKPFVKDWRTLTACPDSGAAGTDPQHQGKGIYQSASRRRTASLVFHRHRNGGFPGRRDSRASAGISERACRDALRWRCDDRRARDRL
jgi:sirohydrochlorin cobaltochelatase